MREYKSILIVDDEIINSKIIKKILKEFEIESTILTDSTQIFTYLSLQKPDLLLLDLVMPVQDGFTTLKLIKESKEYADLPVIILTGDDGEESLANCLKNGAVDYLIKPVRKLELAARVNSAIKIAELNRDLNRNLLTLQNLYEGIEKELEIARKIQLSIVGPSSFENDKVKIVTHLELANRLGGDFYDIKQFGDRLCGTIADVSGHGVSSSLVVMMLKSLLDSFVPTNQGVKELMEFLHKQLYNTIPKGYFIALTHFELENGLFSFSNGGLYDLIVIRNGQEIELLGTKSFAIALVRGASFAQNSINLHSGDKVIIHTDGINESLNNANEMYSRDRLLQIVSQSRDLCAQELLETILMDRQLFTGGINQDDDCTLMVLEIK